MIQMLHHYLECSKKSNFTLICLIITRCICLASSLDFDSKTLYYSLQRNINNHKEMQGEVMKYMGIQRVRGTVYKINKPILTF